MYSAEGDEKTCNRIHPDVSAYVYGGWSKWRLTLIVNIEEHLRRDLYLANAIEGAKDVVVTLSITEWTRRIRIGKWTSTRQLWKTPTGTIESFFTVKLRKAEGGVAGLLLINTRARSSSANRFRIRMQAFAFCGKLSEEEQEDALRVSQQLGAGTSAEQARAARLQCKLRHNGRRPKGPKVERQHKAPSGMDQKSNSLRGIFLCHLRLLTVYLNMLFSHIQCVWIDLCQ